MQEHVKCVRLKCDHENGVVLHLIIKICVFFLFFIGKEITERRTEEQNGTTHAKLNRSKMRKKTMNKE